MVKLRLRRIGKKKQAIYKIVAADSRAARTGKYIESIGTYNPRMEPALIEVNDNRLWHWLKSGAQPSDTVRSLLQRKGLWLRWDLMKKGADEAKVAAELEKWQMLQAEKSRRESEKKARRRATRKPKPRKTETAPAPGGEPETAAAKAQGKQADEPTGRENSKSAEEAAT